MRDTKTIAPLPDRAPHTRNFSRLPDEATILERAAEGDKEAYGRLYTFYYPHLYTSLAFISRSHEDTQEIIHEVFLRIWKARESLIQNPHSSSILSKKLGRADVFYLFGYVTHFFPPAESDLVH